MRAIKIFIFFGLITTITGCVSLRTPMKNATGEVVECRNFGMGWLGVPVALISQQSCESDFREKGFVTFSEVAPPSTTQQKTPQIENTGQPTNPLATVIFTSQVKAMLELPMTWNPRPLSEAQSKNGVAVHAENPSINATLVLAAAKRELITDLQIFASGRQADQARRLKDPTMSAINKTAINGQTALTMYVVGTTADAQLTRYEMTVFEGKSEIAFLNIWTPERNYAKNHTHFADLAALVTGLDR